VSQIDSVGRAAAYK